ncbi:hypothetical protein GLAREA_00259 [Glarea lozoyensis ATCC 20868]|uniref:Uncharacterized protein n=1 Tax=Glarea lozoyensis (strain ATCC 20868 / MF5171) TaxID=1116229 RepID=S3DAU1_GLAL2|nr:uncharacterized protein GLAREA_00259 [Glarea lozoyensis ATCC 20868]EPE29101.1 hypothetical protein GLAREA_00259 [Glarea lozoyensis ATCC 20868]
MINKSKFDKKVDKAAPASAGSKKMTEEKAPAAPPHPGSGPNINPSNSRMMATIACGINQKQVRWSLQVIVPDHYSSVLREHFLNQHRAKQNMFFLFQGYRTEVIQLLVQWLLVPQLRTPPKIQKDEFAGIIKNYCDLWIVADQLKIAALKNQSIYLIHQLETQYKVYNTAQLNLVWKNTSKGSALRQYFLDKFTSVKGKKLQKDPEDFPKEMLIEMLAVAEEQKDAVKDPGEQMAKYYA